MFSSTNRSSAPVSRNVGGRPLRSSERAAAAYCETSAAPGSTPNQTLPAEVVVGRPPDELACIDVRIVGRARAIVEHRVDQVLEGEIEFASIARQQCEPRSQSTTRAFSHHTQPIHVQRELARVLVHPRQRRIAVFDRAGKSGFRCEPIVHGDHYATQTECQLPVSRARAYTGRRRHSRLHEYEGCRRETTRVFSVGVRRWRLRAHLQRRESKRSSFRWPP